MEENKVEVTLAILSEKMDSLRELVEIKFKENSRQHNEITKVQEIERKRTSKLEDWKEKHTAELNSEVSGILKEADKRYASKSVEVHFNKLIYAVITALILAGVGVVIR